MVRARAHVKVCTYMCMTVAEYVWGWLGPRRFATIRDGPRQSTTVHDGPRRSATVRDGPQRSATVPDGPRRSATVRNVPRPFATRATVRDHLQPSSDRPLPHRRKPTSVPDHQRPATMVRYCLLLTVTLCGCPRLDLIVATIPDHARSSETRCDRPRPSANVRERLRPSRLSSTDHNCRCLSMISSDCLRSAVVHDHPQLYTTVRYDPRLTGFCLLLSAYV